MPHASENMTQLNGVDNSIICCTFEFNFIKQGAHSFPLFKNQRNNHFI